MKPGKQLQLLLQSIFDRQIPLFRQVLFVQGLPSTQKHVYVDPLLRQRPLFGVHGFDKQGSTKVVVSIVVAVVDVMLDVVGDVVDVVDFVDVVVDVVDVDEVVDVVDLEVVVDVVDVDVVVDVVDVVA